MFLGLIALPVIAQDKADEDMAGMECPMGKMGAMKNKMMGKMGGHNWKNMITAEELAAYDEETKEAWREIQKNNLAAKTHMYFAIASAIAIGLAVFGGALGQGKAAAAALEGIARNPEASAKIFTPLIISLALIESLVIYALVISILLQLKM